MGNGRNNSTRASGRSVETDEVRQLKRTLLRKEIENSAVDTEGGFN